MSESVTVPKSHRVGASEKTTDVAWALGDRYVGHNWRKTKWQIGGNCSTRATREAKRLKREELKQEQLRERRLKTLRASPSRLPLENLK